MDWFNLLVITAIIVLYSFQTLFCTLFNRHYPGKAEWAPQVFCILEAGAITLVTLALNRFRFHPSGPTLLYGGLNALVLLGFNISMIEAGKRGSYAFFNMAMLYGSILVPMLYSVVFLHEGTSPLQWAGIGLMLVALLLMNLGGKGAEKPKKGYIFFCILLFLCNGLYGVFLKMQTMACENESAEMIVITFGLMGILSLARLALREKGNLLPPFRQSRKSAWFLAACLLSAALAVNGLMAVLPRINSIVFFTVENGGVLLLSSMYAFFLFHEKPTPGKTIGILIAVASMVLLSLPA